MEVLREAYENYNKKDYRYDFFAKEEEIKDLLSNKQIFVFKRNNRNLIFGFVLSEILVPLLASLLVFQFVGNFIIALICFLALFSFILIVFISFRKDFLVIGYTGLYFKKYLKKAQYIPWSTFGKIEYYKGMTGEGNKNFYVICRLSAGKRYKFYPHVYLGNEFRRRIIIGSKVFELCIYFYGLFLHYWENTQVNTEYTVDDKPEVNQAKLIEETSEVISEKKSSEISCPNCGKNNAESSQYCEACGSELNTIQQDLFEDISFDPGDREKIFVMTKIPGDFNIFLDKLSEIMLASNIKVENLKFKPGTVEISEEETEKRIKIAKYEYRMKGGAKIFVHVELYFVPIKSGTNIDVYFKTTMEGMGFMTERITSMLKNYGIFSPQEFGKKVIKAINDALDSI